MKRLKSILRSVLLLVSSCLAMGAEACPSNPWDACQQAMNAAADLYPVYPVSEEGTSTFERSDDIQAQIDANCQ